MRAFTHIFGHVDWSHLIGNMSYLLLLDDIKAEADHKTYILVAHNGISRVVQSYFFDMSNEEYAAFGVKNCQIVRYDF